MKTPLRYRLILWFCDTFGHAKIDQGAWYRDGCWYHVCPRCSRIVSSKGEE